MSDEAPGLLGNYQLGLTCQFLNTRSTSITPTLYVVVVYEGTFNVVNGHCSHMLGVLSRQDVLDSKKQPHINYKLTESIFGGDFFSSIKRGLKGLNNVLKKGKIISTVADFLPIPGSKAVGRISDRLGYGMSGGSLSGGKLSKEELKRRLRGQKEDHKQKYEDEYSYDENEEQIYDEDNASDSD